MAFQRPSLADLIERVQSDFVSRLSLNGAVLRRSVVYVQARVIAGAAHMLYGFISFLAQQVFPDTSEAEFLERQANLFGIARKAAAYASGTVNFTGTNDAVIPAGTVLQRGADQAKYTTQEDATISGGVAAVEVIADAAGATGNADAGVTLSFISPIAGVNNAATVAAGGLTNGANQEADEDLRARLLERMQAPPHGGAADDYVAWAKEVSAVTRAWCYPLEEGAGTVTVRFVTDDAEDGIIPDGAKVTEVQEYIDALRPVTAEVIVVAPVASPLNFTIQVTPATQAVKDAIEAELTDLLRREAEPGGTILLSHIREAVSIAEGESDSVVTLPSANVTHSDGEIATMGTVTWA